MDRWPSRVDGPPPVGFQDRPEHLIQILAVAQEGPTQNAFLNRAELAKRTVATTVPNGGPSFQPVDPDRVERERQDELSAGHEQPCAPELGPQRKPPLGGRKPDRIQGSELEESHGRLASIGHDGKAEVFAFPPLPTRPRNESLESLEVVGGGQMERETSDGVTMASSDEASDGWNSRSVRPAPRSTGKHWRQSSVAVDRGVAAGATPFVFSVQVRAMVPTSEAIGLLSFLDSHVGRAVPISNFLAKCPLIISFRCK